MDLLGTPLHAGLRHWLGDLNGLYRSDPSLQRDSDAAGFEWLDCNDAHRSIISFLLRISLSDLPGISSITRSPHLSVS